MYEYVHIETDRLVCCVYHVGFAGTGMAKLIDILELR
jgi:hypothetical protein